MRSAELCSVTKPNCPYHRIGKSSGAVCNGEESTVSVMVKNGAVTRYKRFEWNT
uniref:Uncharacterized protein n=1 Tax=Aegilops tauschii subsp. strangulata TaxID=200361 RepID=A0A453JDB8_AEGTS